VYDRLVERAGEDIEKGDECVEDGVVGVEVEGILADYVAEDVGNGHDEEEDDGNGEADEETRTGGGGEESPEGADETMRGDGDASVENGAAGDRAWSEAVANRSPVNRDEMDGNASGVLNGHSSTNENTNGNAHTNRNTANNQTSRESEQQAERAWSWIRDVMVCLAEKGCIDLATTFGTCLVLELPGDKEEDAILEESEEKREDRREGEVKPNHLLIPTDEVKREALELAEELDKVKLIERGRVTVHNDGRNQDLF
jgi:hypothetical protein